MWGLVGIAAILAFQSGPIGENTSLGFMLAAVCEAILIRWAWRQLWPALRELRSFGALAAGALALRGIALVSVGRTSTFRQTAAFASLAVAYLHYYFWDVQLQIAALPSVTVFVAVASPQRFAG